MFRQQGPSLEEMGAAFRTLAQSARVRLREESVYDRERASDRDAIARWQRAEGADFSVEVAQAREKLADVDSRGQ